MSSDIQERHRSAVHQCVDPPGCIHYDLWDLAHLGLRELVLITGRICENGFNPMLGAHGQVDGIARRARAAGHGGLDWQTPLRIDVVLIRDSR